MTSTAISLDWIPAHCAEEVLRTAFGQYATGVAVVTTVARDGYPAGITINSFSSVSLDPPLILWCLRRGSASRDAFTTADHFAVNILAAGQEYLARRFAARTAGRFAGQWWCSGPRGMPVLHDRLGVFICRRVRQIDGGDHLIIIGHLEEYEVTEGRSPLVFYGGRYHACWPSGGQPSQHQKGGSHEEDHCP
jgi:flavin reductase (DIM6/NTAB) family NADH-FMN oxidoreductase RutF